MKGNMQSELIKISQLKNNTGQIEDVPKNPRILKDDKYKKLVKSIQEDPEMLSLREVIAYDNNGELVVIAGNMRLKACKEAGLDEVPTKILPKDTPADKLKRYIIKDNNSFGEWSYDDLANEWDAEELDEWGLDTPDTWGEEPEIEEDEAPEVDESEPPKSKLGEVYQLGRHRVMCGDSTDKDVISKLMQAVSPDLIYTDPPYGMFLDADYSGMKPSEEFSKQKGFKAGKKYDNVIGDHDDFNPAFITTIFEMFPETKEVFLWGADYYTELLPERNAGSWVVWDKRITESFDKMYGSSFELCWSKNRHRREIARITWANVFGTEQEFDHKRHHPTQKPIGLSSWFIERYSEQGNNVLDLFLGSGSTLIACEQTDRTCFGMELDEKYVDVVRRRYHKLVTGNEEGWEDGTPAVRTQEVSA